MPTSAPADDLATIDLSDWGFWARPREERFAAFAALRRDRPAAFFPEPPTDLDVVGPGFRALTRHADVEAVSAAPELFCSGRGAVTINDVPPELNELFGSLISTDGPRHRHLRRAIARAFTPRRVEGLVRDMQGLADEVVTAALAHARAGDGTFDLVEHVAAPLPLLVLCDLMGIPREHLPTVWAQSNVITAGVDPEYLPADADRPALCLQAATTLAGLVGELAERRRRTPTDDVVSALVQAEGGEEGLTTREVASFFILLCIAGNETTRNAISHGVRALSQHPGQAELWRSDPGRWSAGAVEEVLRWASPVMWMRRTATGSAVVGGHEFAAGDKLLLLYGAANRDPDVFEHPDTFDITRTPNPHLAFGARGPHHCLGAHLARAEIGVAFRTMFARMPDLQVVGEPDRLHSNFLDGIKHLPVAVGPR